MPAWCVQLARCHAPMFADHPDNASPAKMRAICSPPGITRDRQLIMLGLCMMEDVAGPAPVDRLAAVLAGIEMTALALAIITTLRDPWIVHQQALRERLEGPDLDVALP